MDGPGCGGGRGTAVGSAPREAAHRSSRHRRRLDGCHRRADLRGAPPQPSRWRRQPERPGGPRHLRELRRSYRGVVRRQSEGRRAGADAAERGAAAGAVRRAGARIDDRRPGRVGPAGLRAPAGDQLGAPAGGRGGASAGGGGAGAEHTSAAGRARDQPCRHRRRRRVCPRDPRRAQHQAARLLCQLAPAVRGRRHGARCFHRRIHHADGRLPPDAVQLAGRSLSRHGIRLRGRGHLEHVLDNRRLPPRTRRAAARQDRSAVR